MSRLLKAFSSLVLTGQLCAFAQVPATPPAKALALNAQQVTGVSADRELPVVWAVAKGSLLNKAILVPLALAMSRDGSSGGVIRCAFCVCML